MLTKKLKNQLNIYKEFWELANQANDLAQTGNYDVDMLISIRCVLSRKKDIYLLQLLETILKITL